jgi:hypothetical protein
MTAPNAENQRGPAREKDLKWKRQEMVRWFAPGQLAATGIRAVLSGIFGSYADRREMQAALNHGSRPDEPDPNVAPWNGLFHDYSEGADKDRGFWIDFAADLGDGFDPTYSIAWLMAQPSLPAPAAKDGCLDIGEGHPRDGTSTYRGQIVVLGGDQVYPTPLRDQYVARFSGPYEAALPWVTDSKPPHLYAIPGNHDWYDGLTAFLRVFCQSRWIGGWRTQQHRSYFAIRLPHRWWLLGVDVQLESDLDRPQRDYFCAVAKKMKPGDRVILCTPEPSWVHVASAPNSFDNLAYFEKSVLAPNGAELVLTLTGDMHHYSRYSDGIRKNIWRHHKLTAGGGGAYLLGTELLPDTIELKVPPPEHAPATVVGESKEPYAREAAYPSQAKSRVLKGGAIWLWWKNGSFAVFLGFLYAIYAWFLQSASKLSMLIAREDGKKSSSDFMTFAKDISWDHKRDILDAWWAAIAHSPLLAALTLVIIGALVKFANPDVERSALLRSSKTLQGAVGYVVGAIHGLAHVTLATGLVWWLGHVNLNWAPAHFSRPSWFTICPHWGADNICHVFLFLFEMVLFGGTLGAILFSLFLFPYVNHNEAFASQHLETFKNFLRMQIAPDGILTVYPYGVDEPGRWKFRPDAAPGVSYFSPARPPKVRLIEDPIVLAVPSDPGEQL